MKNFILILRFFLVLSLIWFAVSLLYPHHLFKIEKFEYFIREFLNISWLLVPFVARILIGLLFVISFLLFFYWKKTWWVIFLAPIMIGIPFILNPILLKNFERVSVASSLFLPDKLIEFANDEDEVLLAYLSASCLYCHNAAKKLFVAQQTSKYFPKVKVVGVSEEIEKLFSKTNTQFEYVLISKDEFLELTNYQYPKVHFIKNGKIERVYDGYSLNYKALHDFSKKR